MVDGILSPPQTNISTRSKRTSKPPQRLIEVIETEIAEQTIPGELFSLATMFPVDDTMDQLHSVFYCYKAVDSDPDTMTITKQCNNLIANYFAKPCRRKWMIKWPMGILNWYNEPRSQ